MSNVAQSTRSPTVHTSGSIDCIVVGQPQSVGEYTFLDMALPAETVGRSQIGKILLVRCGDTQDGGRSWSPYLRRPLHVAGIRHSCTPSGTVCLRVLLPNRRDPGYEWLCRMSEGDVVNVIGPVGRDVAFPDSARHLLLVATPATAPLLLPAAEQMLDRNGHVTMVVSGQVVDPNLLSLLQIPVELQIAGDFERWSALIGDGIRWSDALLIFDPSISPLGWAELIRSHRFALDDDYAQILVPADFVCGMGACAACVVSRPDGSLTRACVHGPVFPLTDLVR